MAAKGSSREEPRKSSAAIVNSLIKKISQSIPMSIPTKSLILNSHRGSKPKPEPPRTNPHPAPTNSHAAHSHTPSAHHSRYSPSHAAN